MEFGPSQSPAPTPPRPLHRWANEGRGWALCWRNCTGGQIQLGHSHYAHPIWMGARGRVRSTIRNCAGGPGGLHPPPTVQLGMVRAGYPMVGRSFGHDLVGACIVRRSLYSTQEFVPNDLGLYRWACTVCCVQWAVPTDQLAQFGTTRAKRGPGFRGLWPQLWAPTISPPVGGSITSLCLRWVGPTEAT